MSFENFHPHHKKWKKTYRKSDRYDRGCKPGGGCSYCLNNLLFSSARRSPLLDEEAEARMTDHIRSRLAS